MRLLSIAQRGDRCATPGNIPDQAGWGSEKPNMVEDASAHCRGVELDDL